MRSPKNLQVLSGRHKVDAAAGRRDEAHDSFEKALAQARGAGLFRDMLKGQPNHYEDRLEGKIAAALLLLDPSS